MDHFGLQIDELVTEIKSLREKNFKLLKENNSLKNQLNSKNYELTESKINLEEMSNTIINLKEEKVIIDKKLQMQIKKLENKLRKNDMFKESYRGTSKTRQEEMIRKKIKLLKKNNHILMDCIELFGKFFTFDSEVCKSLCEISNNIEDTVIKKFLEAIINLNDNKKNDK